MGCGENNPIIVDRNKRPPTPTQELRRPVEKRAIAVKSALDQISYRTLSPLKTRLAGAFWNARERNWKKRPRKVYSNGALRSL